VFLRNKGFSIKIYKPEDFHVSYPPKKIRITETALAGERLLGFYKTFPKSEFNAIGKIGLLFSGQGNLKFGIKLALKKLGKSFRNSLDRAFNAYGLDLLEVSEKGPADVLKRADVNQTLTFLSSIVAHELLKNSNPKMFNCEVHYAGLSVGECSAAYCMGLLDFEHASEFINKRATLMQKAVEDGPSSGMIAVLGISRNRLQEYINMVDRTQLEVLSISNHLSSTSNTVSGCVRPLNALMEILKDDQVIFRKMDVAAGFHSSLMEAVVPELEKYLKDVPLKPSKGILYHNLDASVVTLESFKEKIVKQTCSPVKWDTIIDEMWSAGVRTFIEIGPGQVLFNLLKRKYSNTSEEILVLCTDCFFFDAQ